MNPAIHALPVLAYTGPAVEEQSPLLRTGRVFGWAAAALALFFVPIWCVRLGWLASHLAIPEGYADLCLRAVPLLQAFFIGVGISLSILGRRLSGGRREGNYVIAITMNLIAVGLIVAELKTPGDLPKRWQPIGCVF